MDIIRLSNKNLNQGITRYFDSKFIVHHTARNLVVSLNCSVKNLNLKRLTQLAMNGPRRNRVLYNICNERKKEENSRLIKICSCGLHIIHGILRIEFKLQNGTLVNYRRLVWHFSMIFMPDDLIPYVLL